MWFAALDDPQRVPWFSSFLARLLENEPSVTALLETNPFPDKPPTYVRAQFTTTPMPQPRSMRRANGGTADCWVSISPLRI
jgi:hypothetical protein